MFNHTLRAFFEKIAQNLETESNKCEVGAVDEKIIISEIFFGVKTDFTNDF